MKGGPWGRSLRLLLLLLLILLPSRRLSVALALPLPLQLPMPLPINAPAGTRRRYDYMEARDISDDMHGKCSASCHDDGLGVLLMTMLLLGGQFELQSCRARSTGVIVFVVLQEQRPHCLMFDESTLE